MPSSTCRPTSAASSCTTRPGSAPRPWRRPTSTWCPARPSAPRAMSGCPTPPAASSWKAACAGWKSGCPRPATDAPTEGAMPVLLLTEDDVRQLLTMDAALEAVEAGLRRVALDEAQSVPRTRCQTDHVMLHVLSASAKAFGVLGLKAYTTTRQGAQFMVSLYDGRTGALLALIQADYLGQVRTGAASGVATKYMARPDASTVGLFGTGKQARTQIEAVCKVRPVRRVHVYSRTEENRRRFATEMSEVCNTEIVPVARPEQAAEDLDIVITATTSREPVLSGAWLAQGTHLNVIGSNFQGKAEVDAGTLRRSNVIVVDSKEQARLEAG